MLYFELLAQKVHEYDTQAENIYNMDEKGFLIGNLTKGKQIFSKQRYERDGHGSDADQRVIEYCSENKILMTHQLIQRILCSRLTFLSLVLYLWRTAN